MLGHPVELRKLLQLLVLVFVLIQLLFELLLFILQSSDEILFPLNQSSLRVSEDSFDFQRRNF